MASTTTMNIRIDKELKKETESILAALGLTTSAAVTIFAKAIVRNGGIPFELRLPDRKPAVAGGTTREQLDAALMKGIESIQSGRMYTADEVDAELKKEFGI